jgi:hypothetical protein
VDPTALKFPTIGFEDWNKDYSCEVIARSSFKPEPDSVPEAIYLVRLPVIPKQASALER